MKQLLLALLFLSSTLGVFSQTAVCPPQGSAKDPKKQESNILKNRRVDIKPNPIHIPIDSILRDGNDLNRFSNEDYVIITGGYVIGIKAGGPESCNCKTKDEAQHDIHLFIGRTPDAAKADCFVVEITPAFKRTYKIDYEKLIGKKVSVTGYMFLDTEHIGNAKNTCTKCENNWRKTIWEIHPVVNIKEVE